MLLLGEEKLREKANSLATRGYQVIDLDDRSDEVIDVILTDKDLTEETINDFKQLGVKIIWSAKEIATTIDEITIISNKNIVKEANRVRANQ